MSWANHLNKAQNGAEPALPDGIQLPDLMTARDLQTMEFPPVSWVVPDILPEGLTILAGKPKVGKSWLALQVASDVATGDEVLGRPVEQGGVLYAALEDNKRRLKSRLEKNYPQRDWPDRLHLATDWPRLDQGGLEALDLWLGRERDTSLVIIDTLATVKPHGRGRDQQYQADYEGLRGLHGIANDLGIAIVVIHHLRKAESEDPFDAVSGSTGLTGAADATLVLQRTSNGTVLYGRGRDLIEFESAVEFNAETCRWSDLGRPCDVHGSATRKTIWEALKAGHHTPKDISAASDIDYDLCAKTLQRMAEVGEIEKHGYGQYRQKADPLSC